MTRRSISTALVALGIAIFLVGSAQSAIADKFSATVTPSAVQSNSSGPYTVRITNRPTATRSANNAHVAIQGGFVVDGSSLVATTSGGTCAAATWAASLSGTTIDAVSPGAAGDLCPGATLAITFTATAPADEGVWQWTTSLYTDTSAFDLQGSQPTVSVDSTPPPPPTITSQPGDPSNSASASFSFSDTEQGATFRCALDGGAAADCTSPEAYSGLGEGEHTFSVTAVDAAGNESTATSFTWTIDTIPPPAPTITTGLPNVTASTTAGFSLSDSEAAVALLCRLDADPFAPCPSTVSYDSLPAGSHTFQAKAGDAAGNQSSISSFTWTIDLTNPVVTIDPKSEPSKLTNHASASFVFTSNKPSSTFSCQLDGGAFSACTSPAGYSGLASGKHAFAVKAKDSLGNAGLPTIWEWTVDTIPPKTTITHGPDAVSSSSSATFAFTSSEPVSAFGCSLDGGAFTGCSSPKAYSGVAGGPHTFRVRATDLAGNTDPSPPSYSWQVSTLLPPDTTPPGPVKNPKPTVAYGSLKLAWALPTDLDLDHVQIVRTRQPSGTGATSVYAGRSSAYVDRHFQNGTWYRYAIRSYDHAGNASRRVSVDVTPSALLRSPANGAVVKAPPLLRWTAVAKARFYNVQLYRGGHKVLSSWPVRARLQLKRRWRYQHYPFRLKKGRFRWYVWPAFGKGPNATYGQLIGTGTFTVR